MRKLITSLALAAAVIAPMQLAHATETPKVQTVQIVPVDATQSPTTGAAAVIRETRLFAESLGDGLMTAASKMGIAAKEFADSPVGRVLAFGLFMKYFGAMIVKLLMIPVAFFFSIKFFRRGVAELQGQNQVPVKFEYVPRTGLLGWFGLQEKRVTQWGTPHTGEGAAFVPFLIGAVLLVGCFIMIGTF